MCDGGGDGDDDVQGKKNSEWQEKLNLDVERANSDLRALREKLADTIRRYEDLQKQYALGGPRRVGASEPTSGNGRESLMPALSLSVCMAYVSCLMCLVRCDVSVCGRYEEVTLFLEDERKAEEERQRQAAEAARRNKAAYELQALWLGWRERKHAADEKKKKKAAGKKGKKGKK